MPLQFYENWKLKLSTLIFHYFGYLYCAKISNDTKPFKNLNKLVYFVLILPQSNARTDTNFSVVTEALVAVCSQGFKTTSVLNFNCTENRFTFNEELKFVYVDEFYIFYVNNKLKQEFNHKELGFILLFAN